MRHFFCHCQMADKLMIMVCTVQTPPIFFYTVVQLCDHECWYIVCWSWSMVCSTLVFKSKILLLKGFTIHVISLKASCKFFPSWKLSLKMHIFYKSCCIQIHCILDVYHVTKYILQVLADICMLLTRLNPHLLISVFFCD